MIHGLIKENLIKGLLISVTAGLREKNGRVKYIGISNSGEALLPLGLNGQGQGGTPRTWKEL